MTGSGKRTTTRKRKLPIQEVGAFLLQQTEAGNAISPPPRLYTLLGDKKVGGIIIIISSSGLEDVALRACCATHPTAPWRRSPSPSAA